MEVGRTIMLQNAMMQMPTQTWQYCIIQWLQNKALVRRENQDTIALDRRVYIHCDGSVSPFPLSQILSHTLLT